MSTKWVERIKFSFIFVNRKNRVCLSLAIWFQTFRHYSKWCRQCILRRICSTGLWEINVTSDCDRIYWAIFSMTLNGTESYLNWALSGEGSGINKFKTRHRNANNSKWPSMPSMVYIYGHTSINVVQEFVVCILFITVTVRNYIFPVFCITFMYVHPWRWIIEWMLCNSCYSQFNWALSGNWSVCVCTSYSTLVATLSDATPLIWTKSIRHNTTCSEIIL